MRGTNNWGLHKDIFCTGAIINGESSLKQFFDIGTYEGTIKKMTDARRRYMKEWRVRNRSRIREQYREYNRIYYRKRRGSPLGDVFLGTSGLGRSYEKLALFLLPNSTDENKESFHNGWDVNWCGMRIDVKVRNKTLDGAYHFTKKKQSKASHYLCFIRDKKETKNAFLIESGGFKTGKSFSDKSLPTNCTFIGSSV